MRMGLIRLGRLRRCRVCVCWVGGVEIEVTNEE